MRLILLIATLAVIGLSPVTQAVPTPKMSEEQMMAAADLVAEGTLSHVSLLKRWIGDRQGIDTGYEWGEFESTLKVTKILKGQNDLTTFKYFVSAYMEGTWDNPPPMGLVGEGTQAAVTPGTTLRVFLKWNPEGKRFERVHFNSGFVVLKPSALDFPKNENLK
jgi:hypothetical protein